MKKCNTQDIFINKDRGARSRSPLGKGFGRDRFLDDRGSKGYGKRDDYLRGYEQGLAAARGGKGKKGAGKRADSDDPFANFGGRKGERTGEKGRKGKGKGKGKRDKDRAKDVEKSSDDLDNELSAYFGGPTKATGGEKKLDMELEAYMGKNSKEEKASEGVLKGEDEKKAEEAPKKDEKTEEK
jgi:hypothetical protein